MCSIFIRSNACRELIDSKTHICIWWGRFDADYSRNRVLREILARSGWKLVDFRPKLSCWGDLEAQLKKLPTADLVWVPCFRQRDLVAAVRWGQRKKIPVVFDPLISAYDKQVFERRKFSAESYKAKKLLRWERGLFSAADLVIADTWEHARFFTDTLGVTHKRVAVVPVGAEEGLFCPADGPVETAAVPRVLFYGSFLNLQGPETIVQAARLYQGQPVLWQMIGEGPLLEQCQQQAADLENVEFHDWVPYADLPEQIRRADILLGVFGTSEKAGRVIPNKVYQALACGKPLITRSAAAYPDTFHNNDDLGISWVEPGNPQQLAHKVAELIAARESFSAIGQQARQTYESHFSMTSISAKLSSALHPLLN